MQREQIPAYAAAAADTLQAAGFAAYFVGGCVRDLYLGRPVHDWDVATDASAEEVLRLFPKSIPTGLRYGTVTVRIGGASVEVTTFRTDGGYSDHRRPDGVQFVKDVREDLARRDFTVNAMAMTPTGEVLDPFGGVADLRERRLRCVGEPTVRFEEDALRIFRALRFSASLTFWIDPKTAAAMETCAPLTSALSGERVAVETEKMLLADGAAQLTEAVRLGLYAGFGASAGPVRLRGLDVLPEALPLRWCVFAAALLAAGRIRDAAGFLRALRRSRSCIAVAGRGARLALTGLPEEAAKLKALLADYGPETVRCAAAAQDLLRGTSALAAVETVLADGTCWAAADLAVDGKDLIGLGASGREIGALQRALLTHVHGNPADNERTALLRLAASWLRDGCPADEESGSGSNDAGKRRFPEKNY